MSLILTSTIIWIPSECGGRSHPPVLGLRPTIRFQRNVEAWSKVAWDVEIIRIGASQVAGIGNVDLRFSKGASPDIKVVKPGELIELLDAYRVIGVGKILNVTTD